MQKHLFLYAWIFAFLILSILTCLGLIAWMLFTRAPQAAIFSGAQLVKEAIYLASI